MKLVIWHRVSVRVGWYLTSPILPFPLQATSGFRRQPLGLVPFPRFPFPYHPSLLHRVSSRCKLIPQSSSVWSSSSLSLSSVFLGCVLKARRIAHAASQISNRKPPRTRLASPSRSSGLLEGASALPRSSLLLTLGSFSHKKLGTARYAFVLLRQSIAQFRRCPCY